MSGTEIEPSAVNPNRIAHIFVCSLASNKNFRVGCGEFKYSSLVSYQLGDVLKLGLSLSNSLPSSSSLTRMLFAFFAYPIVGTFTESTFSKENIILSSILSFVA
ncbi:MAG TPA: hypothetical protein VFF13_01230 [archaeon]|nr:hypothetical protein [archaeon]